MTDQTIPHYHQFAAQYAQQYDSLSGFDVHASWAHLLAGKTPRKALDIGAGSGRDARWLAALGWQVTAVEPAEKLRIMASSQPNLNITWCDGRLPNLAELNRKGGLYNLILLSAVWMHIPCHLRQASLKRLAGLLSPTGILIITLRFGPQDDRRPMLSVSVEELQALAPSLNLTLTELHEPAGHADQLQRSDVTWKTVALAHNASVNL